MLHLLANLMKRDNKLVPLTSSFGLPEANYKSHITALSDILLVRMVVLSPIYRRSPAVLNTSKCTKCA